MKIYKNYYIFFILLFFLSLFSFVLMPFQDDLVNFGVSFIAKEYGGSDFINNALTGRLIGYKYFYYFLHYLSANYQDNFNLYPVIFRSNYAIFLIISGYVYSYYFCNYYNTIEKTNYNPTIIFFIFIFIFFLSPPSMSISAEEISVVLSLLAYVFFISKKNILIFLSSFLLGLTFFLKAVTICIGISCFFFILIKFLENKYFQEKKVILLFLFGGLVSIVFFLIWIIFFYNDFLNFYVWGQSGQFNKDIKSIILTFLIGLFTLLRHYPLLILINFLFILTIILNFNKLKFTNIFLSFCAVIILAIGQFIQVKSNPIEYTGYIFIAILFVSHYSNILFFKKNLIFVVPVLFLILVQQSATIYYDPLKILGNYPNALSKKTIRANMNEDYISFIKFYEKKNKKSIKQSTCLYLDQYASYFLKCNSENYFLFYLGSQTRNDTYNNNSNKALVNTKADIIIVNNDWCHSCKDLNFLDEKKIKNYEKYLITIIGPDRDQTNLYIKKIAK